LEKFMRSILTFFCWLALASSVCANPITVHIPYSKTGNAQATTRLILDGLEQRGWQFDERVTANPHLSNETFNSATQPMLMLWGTDLAPTRSHPVYRSVPTKQDLVTVTYLIPRYICAVKNITAEDYASRDRVFSIGTTVQPADEQYLQALNQHLGTRHKIIKYNSSRDLEGAVAAREIDLVSTSVGLRLEQQGQVRCLFNTTQQRVGSTPLITDQFPHMVPRNFMVASYLVARNLDAAALARLRQDIVSVQQAHAPYTAYIERNRNPVAPLTLDQQLRLINELDRNIP
jgi:hypothetical protein